MGRDHHGILLRTAASLMRGEMLPSQDPEERPLVRSRRVEESEALHDIHIGCGDAIRDAADGLRAERDQARAELAALRGAADGLLCACERVTLETAEGYGVHNIEQAIDVLRGLVPAPDAGEEG